MLEAINTLGGAAVVITLVFVIVALLIVGMKFILYLLD